MESSSSQPLKGDRMMTMEKFDVTSLTSSAEFIFVEGIGHDPTTWSNEADLRIEGGSSEKEFLSELAANVINNASRLGVSGDWGTVINSSDQLPLQLIQISPVSRDAVIAYCFIFVIAAVGNISVLFSVIRHWSRIRTRITILILHLCIADLIVTFFLIPMEIIWRITIQWYGGNLLCKLCQFFRAFGLYLSSMLVTSISIDRFFAVIYPLRLASATKRVRRMLKIAWISAFLCALPQVIVFKVTSHPKYPSFQQCVTQTFSESSREEQEFIYNLFSVSALYFIPLFFIIVTYSMILWKIHRKSQLQRSGQETENVAEKCINSPHNSSDSVPIVSRSHSLTPSRRRSSVLEYNRRKSSTKIRFVLRVHDGGAAMLVRARAKTLKLTVIIVITFITCWSPYVCMTLWYMIDRESASQVNPRVQEALFIFAIANSVVNPLIYGTYQNVCYSSRCHTCPPYFTSLRRRVRKGSGETNTNTPITNHIMANGHSHCRQESTKYQRHLNESSMV